MVLMYTVGGCVHTAEQVTCGTSTHIEVQYCIKNNITRAVMYDLVW